MKSMGTQIPIVGREMRSKTTCGGNNLTVVTDTFFQGTVFLSVNWIKLAFRTGESQMRYCWAGSYLSPALAEPRTPDFFLFLMFGKELRELPLVSSKKSRQLRGRCYSFLDTALSLGCCVPSYGSCTLLRPPLLLGWRPWWAKITVSQQKGGEFSTYSRFTLTQVGNTQLSLGTWYFYKVLAEHSKFFVGLCFCIQPYPLCLDTGDWARRKSWVTRCCNSLTC